MLDQIRGGSLRKQAHRVALKAETEPLFEPDRSEDARGIVLETACMQHADRAGPKIALPSVGVEQATELARIELYRYGIDRKVPPAEILFDRRRQNRRQDSWLRVGLSPGRRDIHLEPVWEHEPRRRKPFKHRQPSPIPVGHQPRESDPLPFHSQIKIQSDLSEQEVSNDTAHDIDLTALLIPELPNFSK